jgi:hypothetical protein
MLNPSKALDRAGTVITVPNVADGRPDGQAFKIEVDKPAKVIRALGRRDPAVPTAPPAESPAAPLPAEPSPAPAAGDGPTVFEHACRLGAEGIVSKKIDGTYRSGPCPVRNPASIAVQRERSKKWNR